MAKARHFPGLQIYAERSTPREYEHLSERSYRYRMIAPIIDLALSIHETEEGREALVLIANKTVGIRREYRSHHRHIYRDTAGNMREWVDRFLRQMRRGFPSVYLANTRECESITDLEDWGDEMLDFEPDSAGRIRINILLVNSMLAAFRSQPDSGSNYIRLKFQMVVLVARAIVHFLTSYLTGINSRAGKAGRYWEKRLLGGIPEFWEKDDDIMGAQQAGVPYLMEDECSQSTAQRISIGYIRRFVNGFFTFPVQVARNSPATTRAKLRDISQETTDLRLSASPWVQPYASPLPAKPAIKKVRFKLGPASETVHYVPDPPQDSYFLLQ